MTWSEIGMNSPIKCLHQKNLHIWLQQKKSDNRPQIQMFRKFRLFKIETRFYFFFSW